MPTAAEIRAREEARQSRTERELARLEGKTTPKPKPKPKPKEKAGTGRALTAETESARVRALKAKLDAARKAGNTTFAAKVEAQLAEIRKNK